MQRENFKILSNYSHTSINILIYLSPSLSVLPITFSHIHIAVLHQVCTSYIQKLYYKIMLTEPNKFVMVIVRGYIKSCQNIISCAFSAAAVTIHLPFPIIHKIKRPHVKRQISRLPIPIKPIRSKEQQQLTLNFNYKNAQNYLHLHTRCFVVLTSAEIPIARSFHSAIIKCILRLAGRHINPKMHIDNEKHYSRHAITQLVSFSFIMQIMA